jgi:hypothetical protein
MTGTRRRIGVVVCRSSNVVPFFSLLVLIGGLIRHCSLAAVPVAPRQGEYLSSLNDVAGLSVASCVFGDRSRKSRRSGDLDWLQGATATTAGATEWTERRGASPEHALRRSAAPRARRQWSPRAASRSAKSRRTRRVRSIKASAAAVAGGAANGM